MTCGLLALVWALTRAENGDWASAPVIGGLIAAGVLLAAFAMIETRLSAAPLVPFSAFGSRLLSAGSALSCLSFVPVLPTWPLLTLYLQNTRGYTPLQAGLVFLPMSLAVVAGAQLPVGQQTSRRLIACGMRGES